MPIGIILAGVLLLLCIAITLLMYRKLKQEKALHKKETDRLASILDAVQAPITVTDKNMNWTFINRSVEQFLGVKRKDIIGEKCSRWNADICNTENCGIVRLRNGFSETYFDQHGGSFHVIVSYLYDEKGEIDGHVEVVRDITDIKQMAKSQAEAQAASRAKSAFLAKVSHEIRTPMNAILGITEIQLQNKNIPPDTQEALEKIYNSGYLLLGIVNDILDLSKIEAGKLELSPVNYDTASLISDIIHLNVILSESKPIEFNLEVDENIPTTLFGDELRIKQILNNLLSNAFKYTDSGVVSLTITAEYAGQDKASDGNHPAADQLTPQAEAAPQVSRSEVVLVFCVSDTGQGLTQDQLANLFTEYTRFNPETNRTTEGTGLGMNITRNLVHLMGGEISVQSEKDKGSTFTVRLPQGRSVSGVLGRELTNNLKQFRLGSITQIKKAPQIVREYMPYGKVLVVDDVETNLYVCRGLLSPYGLNIETAISGFEAIEKIKHGSTYDIVFMDHFMPKMDGIQAVRIIRNMGYMRPIVALTANAISGQADVFLANGFDSFISKPIDIRQMNAELNRLIRDQYPPEVVEAARRSNGNLRQNSGNNTPPSLDPQLAAIFTHDAEKAVNILQEIHSQNAYEGEGRETYIINTHAMKSALANVGETDLSAFALKLETAGRQGDFAVMTGETPVFVEKLRAAIERIKPREDNGTEQTTVEDEAYLHEQLGIIQAACKVYDKKAAKDALACLRQKAWPSLTRELLNTISVHLLHSEFDEAANAAAGNKLQGTID